MKNVQENKAETKEILDKQRKSVDDVQQRQQDLVTIIKGSDKKCQASEKELEENYKKIHSLQAELQDFQFQSETL